jgi:hypothetical protein
MSPVPDADSNLVHVCFSIFLAGVGLNVLLAVLIVADNPSFFLLTLRRYPSPSDHLSHVVTLLFRANDNVASENGLTMT